MHAPAPWLVLLLLGAPLLPARAQSGSDDAWSRGLAGSGLAGATPGPFAVQPRLPAEGGRVAFGTTHPYGLPELATVRLGAEMPLNPWAVGLSWDALHLDGYRRDRIGLRLARASKALAFGVQVRSTRVRAGPWPSRVGVTVLSVLRATREDGLSIAVALGRPVAGRDGPSEPPSLRAGLAWAAGRRATLFLDAARHGRWPVSCHMGMEVAVAPPLILLAGVASGPERAAAGLRVRLARLAVTASVDRHVYLGRSVAIDTEVRW